MNPTIRKAIRLLAILIVTGWVGACGDSDTDKCGNGILDREEQCDGTTFGSNTCESLGFTSGDLQCTADCKLNTDACKQNCGNNRLDPEEDCDGKKLRFATCQGIGYADGALACNAKDCTFDVSGCEGSLCGNGKLEKNEQCDGALMSKSTCQELGYDSGQLGCTPECQFNTSNCEGDPCGNGFKEAEEECDMADHGGRTCLNMGYTGGSLGCDSDCKFDTKNCSRECTDDTLGNDAPQSAPIVQLPYSQGDLVMCAEKDEDWFRINMLARHRYTIQIMFSHAAGDIDAFLNSRPDDAHRVAIAASETDNEVLEYVVPNNRTAPYYLVVRRYQATEPSQTYSITISDEGEVDCFIDMECEAEEFCINNRCRELQVGDTCVDPIVVETFPYSQTGIDISLFANDFYFGQPTCTGFYDWGRDVIFRLNLDSGQTMNATVTSSFDASLAVVEDCVQLPAPEDACLEGTDVNFNPAGTSTETISHTAEDAETIYLIVDHFQQGPKISGTFDITISVE